MIPPHSLLHSELMICVKNEQKQEKMNHNVKIYSVIISMS